MLCTPVGEDKSVSGSVQRRKKPLCSFRNSLFSEFQHLTDCSFSNVCPPYQRNRTPAGKTHVKVSLRTKEHLRTAAHCYTRKRIQTLHGNEASDSYSCSTCQVQVRTAFRDFNHQTPQCISNQIQNFNLPFNLNWPMARQPVIFSSSWLSSLRLELQTLANYTIWVRGKNTVPRACKEIEKAAVQTLVTSQFW